jgi:hypothetical protein
MQCILQAAVERNVPANVLLAIGTHEAGVEGTALKNKNGSFDYGRNGINSVHLAELGSYGVPAETIAYYLKYDGCYNYAVAAYLLQRELSNCRSTFWTCVGNYHSKTPAFNNKYQALIKPLAASWANYLEKNFNVRSYFK